MKMKLFAAMMAAAALFAACNKETNFGGENSVPEGLPTTASISVTAGNLGTRATYAASQAGESDLTTVDILIFNNNGVLETLAQSVKPGADGKYNVRTTTGEKTVYVVANNGGLVGNLQVGMTLGAFQATTIAAASANGSTHAVDVPIARAGNFLMIGSAPASLSEEEALNSVGITVTRAAAKSQLLFKGVQASDSFKPENVAVTFGDAASMLAQLQTVMSVVAPAASTGTLTPWDAENSKTTSVNWIAARTTDFDTSNAQESAAVVDFSHYMPENIISGEPLMNNTTCMIVRVKATPTTWSSEEGSQTGDGTFYAIVKYTSNQADQQGYETLDSYYGIYKDRTAAESALAAIASEKDYYGVIDFTGGYCYYRLNLRDITKTVSGGRYNVLRNNFYKVTVTEINNIGWNNPTDLVNPDDIRPVETETSLDVTITVADWLDVNMNEPLG